MLKPWTMCLAGALSLALPQLAAAEGPGHALELHAEGVQIYSCGGPGGAWTLKGPDAVLRDDAGRVVAHHSAGPAWRALDGSAITGTVVSASPSPVPGAVAWLVLRATSTGGPGLFAHVTYVTRTQTSGGTAPAGACRADARATDHADARVAYRAVYSFFTP